MTFKSKFWHLSNSIFLSCNELKYYKIKTSNNKNFLLNWQLLSSILAQDEDQQRPQRTDHPKFHQVCMYIYIYISINTKFQNEDSYTLILSLWFPLPLEKYECINIIFWWYWVHYMYKCMWTSSIFFLTKQEHSSLYDVPRHVPYMNNQNQWLTTTKIVDKEILLGTCGND